MQANTGRRRDPAWPAVRQQLLAKGSITRYKFSVPQPIANPSLSATALKRLDLHRSNDGRPREKEKADVMPSQQTQEFPLPLLLYQKNIGGLRGDPFNMYPVESKGCVQGAVDYYAQVYAPFAIRRPKIAGGERDSNLLKTYWHQALQDAMLFEVVIAFSQVLQVLHKVPLERVSPEILFYAGRSLKKLTTRLTSNADYCSDTVLVTIITLMGVDYMTGNIDAFKAHLRGLRHLVKLRGGLESLGMDGFIKARVINWETFWAHREKQLDGHKHQSEKVPYNGLKYPEHPFSSELCAQISKLPPGISELALTRKLSTRVIDLAVQYATWQQGMQDPSRISQRGDDESELLRSGADASVAVIECSGLHTTERCLVIALLAYTISIDVQKVVLSSLHPYIVQTQVRILPQLDGMPESEWDYIAWVALVLRETMGSSPSASVWANRVIRDFEKYRGSNCDWEQLKRDFFPIPATPRQEFSETSTLQVVAAPAPC